MFTARQQENLCHKSRVLINVSIVEDKDKTRDSLRVLIDGTTGFRCVSAHASAEDALENMPLRKTQVVLVDLGLPHRSGIECVYELKTRHPGLLVLILTVHEDVERIFQSLAAGAHGYLLKTTEPAEILAAIRDVYQGGAPMSPPIARKVIQHFHQLPNHDDNLARLTKREQEIMCEVATGCTFKEIAEKKGIGYETVKAHVRNVYHKLHVTSRTSAVVKFLGRKWREPATAEHY